MRYLSPILSLITAKKYFARAVLNSGSSSKSKRSQKLGYKMVANERNCTGNFKDNISS